MADRGEDFVHTPNTSFRNLPLNSARTGNATEGALFISEQLSTDGALRKGFGINMSLEAI